MTPLFNYSGKIQFRKDQLFLGIEELREDFQNTDKLLATPLASVTHSNSIYTGH